MAEILLCRHATTDANANGRFLSRTDLELNAQGREQALQLGEYLKTLAIERCFVSPMKRCVQTLELALAECTPIVRSALREVDFGEWEMLTSDEIDERWPGALAQRRRSAVHFRPPGGESFSDVAMRVAPLLDELRDGRVLVVSHRGTLGVLERLLRRVPLDYRDVAPMEPAQLRSLSFNGVPDQTPPSGVSKTSLQ